MISTYQFQVSKYENKKLSKMLDPLGKNNQFTFLTRLRVIAETWRAQYRSIYAHSFSPTLPISFSFFFFGIVHPSKEEISYKRADR